MEDVYQTIAEVSSGIFKDKGSKFLAFAYPVQTEEEVKQIISSLKKEHHSARHHCYAWRMGTENIVYRTNDDGEPSSTAGKPILGQLLSFNLTNTMVVVVRYFGGTLLGVSGLINAYKNAAADALSNAKIIQKRIETTWALLFTYHEMQDVMNLIKIGFKSCWCYAVAVLLISSALPFPSAWEPTTCSTRMVSARPRRTAGSRIWRNMPV